MMAKKPKKAGCAYDVGYKKPPKEHQFKPGQSGNPRGRPRGAPTIEEIIQREGSRLIRGQSGGQVVHIPKLEALIRRLFQLGLEGDLAALRLILSMVAHNEAANKGVEEATDDATSLIPDDDMLRRILARFDHLQSPKKESNDD